MWQRLKSCRNACVFFGFLFFELTIHSFLPFCSICVVSCFAAFCFWRLWKIMVTSKKHKMVFSLTFRKKSSQRRFTNSWNWNLFASALMKRYLCIILTFVILKPMASSFCPSYRCTIVKLRIHFLQLLWKGIFVW